MKISRGGFVSAIIIVLLAIDQVIKVVVKLNMHLGEEIRIADWFFIKFIENNGMAWGMELGSKTFLSLFRIVTVGAIAWYNYRLVRARASFGYLAVVAMIWAGAVGNIFDSLFYGQIFTESTEWRVATFTDFGDGYAPVLMGKVVDMFYFPIVDTILPDWFPLWGGERFVFFSPIFNFADACISVGVLTLLVFFRKKLDADLSRRNRKTDIPEETEKEN